MDLVKPIANIYSYGFYRNLFHIFPSLIVFFMYFISLLDFLEILKWNRNKKKEKHRNSAGSAFGPRLRLAGVAQRPIRPGRPGHPARAWVRRVRLPHRVHARGDLVARPPSAHWWSRQLIVGKWSTNVEHLTHQARCGGRVLTEVARHRRGDGCGLLWRCSRFRRRF
jgi:hypothetical protein